MSVTIRLTKTGRKNAPSYRVVATKTKTKRDGKALEILGHFDPSHNPAKLKIDEKRLKYWQGVGAITSPAVKKLAEGKYQYVKYAPNKAKAEAVDQKNSNTVPQ